MTVRTYSLAEYTAVILGPGPDGSADTVEPAKLEWMRIHLRGQAEPVLPGYKVARRWRATQSDVERALEILHPNRVALPDVPRFTGMTRTSRRRLSA